MNVLKHVFRRFGMAPTFTAMALVTLALGIGANMAIFSVINGVLIKPLPFPHSQDLVSIWHAAPGLTGVVGDLDCSPGMYFTYREENRTFQEFGLWENRNASVTGIGDPEELRALLVTYGTLQALEVQPAVGQWFSQADDTPGSPETVLLTFGYWQRRFGGDYSVVGRTLMVDSRPRTVIGVMPRDFQFLDLDPELILPERFDRNGLLLGSFGQHGIARLRPGVTLQQANADLGRMLGIWLKAWPVPPGASRALFENAHLAPKLRPLREDVVGDIGATLWVLMGTIGLVLLIACANVANLLLVRAEGRQQELAIRAALGAGWGRIAREMLLESLTLGVLGGVLGLGLAYAAVRILVAKRPRDAASLDRNRNRSSGTCLLAGGFPSGGPAVRNHPGGEIRWTALGHSLARGRTFSKLKPRETSCPQCSGGGSSRHSVSPASRLRPHDSDVSGVAEHPARIRASRRTSTVTR